MNVVPMQRPPYGFTQAVLMRTPLATLATFALLPSTAPRDRINAAEALHARVDELNGAAWATLSEKDRLRIKAAMQIDTTDFN